MVQRRFGPTLGAGVAIVEKDADKTITPATLGVTAYTGILEKGPLTKLVRAAKKQEFNRRLGSYIPESLVPDAAFDFYNLSNGKGELNFQRITDGSGVDAEITLYSRNPTNRAPVLLVKAGYQGESNPGRWAGKKQVIVGDFVTASGNTLDTGKTMLKNEFKGATLVLSAIPGKSFEVVSNDVAGVLTFNTDVDFTAELLTVNVPEIWTIDFNGQTGSTHDVSGAANHVLFSVIDNAGVVTDHYAWLNVTDGANSQADPAVVGRTGHQVNVLAADAASDLATKWSAILNAVTNLGASPATSVVTHTGDFNGNVTDAADAGTGATIAVTQQGANNILYSVELFNSGKSVGIRILDGDQDPENEFGLEVFVDGVLQSPRYPDLSMDPNSARYVEKVINNNTSNFDIVVTDLNTGTVTADTRPANWSAESLAVTATTLQARIHDISQTVADSNVVTSIGAPTFGGSIVKDTLTLTVTDDSTPGSAVFSVASAVQGALEDLTEGVAYVTNEYLADFTIANTGSGAFTNGDVIVIGFFPFGVNALADQTLIPDYDANRRVRFQIISNTVDTITVAAGSDMTTVAVAGERFLVESITELGGGYDGIEDITDTTYTTAYDTGTSLLKQMLGQNKGLVKLATPGVTSTSVQKAGVAFGEAHNWQYRYEIPANITDESSAEEYINDTLGRNDFAKVHFPSYAYVNDPLSAGLKLVTLTGAIHGREAKIANDFGGYHKIAGGVDVTLPTIVKLTTGDKVLDEEFLNPVGINVIVKKQGNFVLWGARTVSIDPAFKFAQHREQLSHYENIFRDNFDFIIFAINNVANRERLRTSFITFFLPEFAKGAITGNNFQDAVSIKIDDENNPPEEEAAGNLNAEIKVRIPETVERFVITMSKAGIFEDLAAA